MKTQKIFFLLLALLAFSAASAQTDALKFKPLQFSQSVTVAKFFDFSFPATTNFSANPETNHSLTGFDPAVHYPAFFCKMELRNVDRFGIWIKVHAGDYDTYSRPQSSH